MALFKGLSVGRGERRDRVSVELAAVSVGKRCQVVSPHAKRGDVLELSSDAVASSPSLSTYRFDRGRHAP